MVAQARRLLGENSVVSSGEGARPFRPLRRLPGDSGGPDLASGRVLIVGWWDEVVIFLIPRWFGTGGEWY
jgi:hypothetical protein